MALSGTRRQENQKALRAEQPAAFAAAITRALDSSVYADAAVKERLQEFFTLQKMSGPAREQKIVCLLSPPGMGKTAMVRALCTALEWQLIQVPVGSVSTSEGMVVGSRRSDFNALAGLIVNALNGIQPDKSAVLLENIDRIEATGTLRSTVSIFEIINSMQDYAVKNRYMTAPVDISRLTFIATAQNLATVPPGVREKLDVISLPSYTERDKIRIARRYILPELTAAHGLADGIVLSENALTGIIRGYTREAGVSELRKNLVTLCRALFRRNAVKQGKKAHVVSARTITAYLGRPRFLPLSGRSADEVGVVTALGRSERGGTTVTLELLAMKGDGRLVCTGNTDKMLQESALVAIDYVRSHAHLYGVAEDFHKHCDIHLHMLDGSMQKQGVSAGTAIVTALVSALTGRPVKRGVGMTGEIGLRGNVIGVRDIRDKVLGAIQAGLDTIILPGENAGDVRDMPAEVKRNIRFILAGTTEEVVDQALLKPAGDRARS